MASGGYRYDFTDAEGFTPGEDRTIRLPVYDENDVILGSFPGGATWGFRVLAELGDLDEWSEATTGTLIHKTDADITASAPNLDIPIAAVDWPAPGMRWFEAWRTDSGNHQRIAWGKFPIIE